MLELKVDAQQQEIDRLNDVNNELRRDNSSQLDGDTLACVITSKLRALQLHWRFFV